MDSHRRFLTLVAVAALWGCEGEVDPKAVPPDPATGWARGSKKDKWDGDGKKGKWDGDGKKGKWDGDGKKDSWDPDGQKGRLPAGIPEGYESRDAASLVAADGSRYQPVEARFLGPMYVTRRESNAPPVFKLDLERGSPAFRPPSLVFHDPVPKWDGGPVPRLFLDHPFLLTAQQPFGFLDGVTPDGRAYGWAYDTAAALKPVEVRLYRDGAMGTPKGVFLGIVIANQRRPDVNEVGIPGHHGFSFYLPQELHDGRPHWIYAHVTGASRDRQSALQGSPLRLLVTPRKKAG